MKRLILGLICSLLMCCNLIGEQDVQLTWESAATAYDRGVFTEAAKAYESLLLQHDGSSVLYHNLGNCYYRMERIPEAILQYERALKLNPQNKETKVNLKLAMNGVEDAVVPLPEFFLQRWMRRASWICIPLCWGILSLIFLWTAVGVGVFNALRGKIRLRSRALVVSTVLCGICLFFGFVRYLDMHSNKYGIIMPSSLSLHVAPDLGSAQVREISGGEKVVMLDSLESFYKVRLMNYEEGWVPYSALEKI